MRVNQDASDSFGDVVQCFTGEIAKSGVGFRRCTKNRLQKFRQIRARILRKADCGGGQSEKNAFSEIQRLSWMIRVTEIVEQKRRIATKNDEMKL